MSPFNTLEVELDMSVSDQRRDEIMSEILNISSVATVKTGTLLTVVLYNLIKEPQESMRICSAIQSINGVKKADIVPYYKRHSPTPTPNPAP